MRRSDLVKTGEVDHADWNYRPLLGWIQRLRLGWVCSMLEGQRFERLLEVGYGSGVFMPALCEYCHELYGMDIHGKVEEVRNALASNGVAARLYSGSVSKMSFPDDYFGCIVCVSTLEFVEDLESACEEIERVLAPNGRVLVVVPGHSKLLDLGLWVLAGESAERDYGSRRQHVVPTLLRHFSLEERASIPETGWIMPRFYTGLKLRLGASQTDQPRW